MSRRSFHFNLSPVLGLRNRAVEQARAQLGRAIRERVDAQASLDHARSLGNAAPSRAKTVAQLGGATIHRTALARARHAAEQALRAAEVREGNARRSLADAICNQEALLSLRAQSAEAHRARADRAEASVLDDIAISSHSPSRWL
ncbi:hypothetical protein [Rubrivirga sp.]|uniref:hypothetical protein n=1 Tax=Rubrivirga sp. TaxID=1885344 RepID=UPI003C793D48